MMEWDFEIKSTFNAQIRDAFAERILECLCSAVPGSTASLCGSLATGNADVYSDIDVHWIVAGDSFEGAVSRTRKVLSTVGNVLSLRVDPDTRASVGYRLVFVRFASLPLFWRVDLEISIPAGCQKAGDSVRRSSLPSDWSLPESALANAVAAIKAHQRNNDEAAHDLLRRAFERL
jgi:predicted nucleotidyltransferase